MVLVTTINFRQTIEVGDPVSQAKIFDAQSADELVLLDINGSVMNRNALINVIKTLSEQIFIPLTVGGGIKSIVDIKLLLSNGADKLSINRIAIKSPDIINQASRKFGSSTVVVSIDYKFKDGKYLVWLNRGTEKTDLDPIKWGIECEKRGAGEILLCSIDKDGTKSGLDIKMIKKMSSAVRIPVIASGGCGLSSHFTEGYLKGNVQAVSAGTHFCFKDEGFMQVRAHIKNAGIPIRIHT